MSNNLKYVESAYIQSANQTLSGDSVDLNNLLLIPRNILNDIETPALLLYGILMSDLLSDKSIVDYKGRHCIIYKINDIRKFLNCSYKSAWKYIKCLESKNLIHCEYLNKNKGYMFYLLVNEDIHKD